MPSSKIQLPPIPGESPALRLARLGAQARLNGVTATPYGVGPILWAVPSQTKAGGHYTVEWRDGGYNCGCPGAARGCAHVALIRTRPTPCPICGGTAIIFAPPRGTGAVYCGCGLMGDLSEPQTDTAWGYFRSIPKCNLLAVLWAVARHVAAPATERAVA
jgi:hypothetical protein